MGRHAFHQQRRDLPVIEFRRKVQKLVGRIVSHFGVAAKGRDAIGDPVSRAESGDVATGRLHDADPLESDDHRTGRNGPGMGNASAMVGVGKFTPTAVCRRRTSPGAGSGTAHSCHCITSGGPS